MRVTFALVVARRLFGRPWVQAALALLLLWEAPVYAQVSGRESMNNAEALVELGDSIYALKRDYVGFSKSLQLYDSALAVAEAGNDSIGIAEALFAKGRVYDAWNRDPGKTVSYFARAAALFRRLPVPYRRYLYARCLVAHAYDKIADTARATAEVRSLYAELAPQPDSILRTIPFTIEMALTATQVGRYSLADSVLASLTRRDWISNDPKTYNYLDHYMLIRARLDVYGKHTAHSLYLDSLQAVATHSANFLDRGFYLYELAGLYAASGRYANAYRYLKQGRELTDSLDQRPDQELRQALAASELQAETRRQEMEQAGRQNRNRIIWVLSISMGVILALLLYIYRQYQQRSAQARRLAVVNLALDDKVAQVELLNKEMQHRIKNNLSMIHALLQMQESQSADPAVIENMKTARLRVESIASLHNQLQQGPASGADLGAYLKGMVHAVIACLSHNGRVQTRIRAATVALPESSCLPLALILNEWVTNSIKYAAPPPGTLLELDLRIEAAESSVRVSYHDNGLAPAALPGTGLGNRIVTLLTRQLKASLASAPGQPYQYTLIIPAA